MYDDEGVTTSWNPSVVYMYNKPLNHDTNGEGKGSSRLDRMSRLDRIYA